MPIANLSPVEAHEQMVADSLEMDRAWMEGTLDEWIRDKLEREKRTLFGESAGIASGPEQAGEGDGVASPNS